MKKFIFSVATIFATNFAFSQITLEHSFPIGESVLVYKNDNQTFYCTTQYDSNIVNIYNSDYSLYKKITLQIPNGYNSVSFPEADKFYYSISKNIFNDDDKIELLIAYGGNFAEKKLQIINEDGLTVKDFANTYYDYDIDLFTDKTVNKNKLVLRTSTNLSEVYSLPTTSLSSKEINYRNKLSAFPIPTNKILNVLNPQNGVNIIEVYDTSGKLVMNKGFANSENKITIDVENLPKGIYIYKVGDLSSKFIKN